MCSAYYSDGEQYMTATEAVYSA
eukprot:COSAG02_NODE_47288_length_342_cov_0.847737_1_plen_22_part_01